MRLALRRDSLLATLIRLSYSVNRKFSLDDFPGRQSTTAAALADETISGDHRIRGFRLDDEPRSKKRDEFDGGTTIKAPDPAGSMVRAVAFRPSDRSTKHLAKPKDCWLMSHGHRCDRPYALATAWSSSLLRVLHWSAVNINRNSSLSVKQAGPIGAISVRQVRGRFGHHAAFAPMLARAASA
jgi:hypothetical protein